MNLQEVINANLRFSILELLEEDPAYSHNEAVIKGGLNAIGHAVSTDQLRTQLHWLQEQGCVKLDESTGLIVARLTSRGEDVAFGRARVPGISRPPL